MTERAEVSDPPQAYVKPAAQPDDAMMRVEVTVSNMNI